MNFDYTVSVGTLMQVIAMIGGGGIIYGQLKSNMGFIRAEMSRLADVPLTLARHDERLKNLEKAD